MATPTRVGWSDISNRIGWQTALSALTDIKGIFGALANRLDGRPVSQNLCGERETARLLPTESKRCIGKARAAVFENTSGPHRSSIVSEDVRRLTDGWCDLNGNVRPLCRNDAGALCGKSCTIGMSLPTSEPPTARVCARTKPNPSKPVKIKAGAPGSVEGRQAS
jgi:hypothetical protein